MPGIPIYTVQQLRLVVSNFKEKIEGSRIMIRCYETTIQVLGETPLRLRKIVEHETKIRIWEGHVQDLEDRIENMIRYHRSIFREREGPPNG